MKTTKEGFVIEFTLGCIIWFILLLPMIGPIMFR